MAPTRWHHASCERPDVQVKDNIVSCRACGGQHPTGQRGVEEAPSSSLTVPPSRPIGQLNLHWPAGFPYVKMGFNLRSTASDRADDPGHPERADDRDVRGDPPDADDRPPAATIPLPVYGKTLASDDFRLLCLAAESAESADDENGPVHVALETFALTHCPPYETVSYTWGGEDNDYAPRWPIFAGPYWDVIWQTRNCRDMLRHVRPPRGTRMVWVDALCINQDDLPERTAQVACMGRIYMQCVRVIVYLGADMVGPPQRSPPFPERRRLDELDALAAAGTLTLPLPLQKQQQRDEPFGLKDVLARKYFSRVWVIQELVLAPQAVLRIGNMDFWADATTAGRLARRGWAWDTTAAPWVQYLAQAEFPAGRHVYDLLGATVHAQASDPRDRLFGVLGIFPQAAQETRGGGDIVLQPDYSLAPQQVFIGLVALCIVKLKMPWILVAAAGQAAPPHFPSWLPDCTSHHVWKRVFAGPPPAPPADDGPDGLGGASTWYRRPNPPSVDNPETEGDGGGDDVSGTVPAVGAEHGDDTPAAADHDNVWSAIVQDGDTYAYKRKIYLYIVKIAQGYLHRKPSDPRITPRRIRIDTDIGALSLRLIRLCVVSAPLVCAWRGKTLRLFKMQPARDQEETPLLYVVSAMPLDTIARPGCDELFLLNLEREKTIVYLVLRPVGRSHIYKIVAVCPHVYMAFYRGVDGHLKDLDVGGLTTTLAQAVREARASLDNMTLDTYDHWGPWGRAGVGFVPLARQRRQLLPLYYGLINERRGASPDFPTAWLSCIDAQFRPRVADGGFLEVSYGPADWKLARPWYLKGRDGAWQWRVGSSHLWKAIPQTETLLPESTWGRRMHVRLPLASASAAVREIFPEVVVLQTFLDNGLNAFGNTAADLKLLLESSENDARYETIGCPGALGGNARHWTWWLVSQRMELDGSVIRVHIV